MNSRTCKIDLERLWLRIDLERLWPHPNRDRLTVDTTVNVYLDAESIAIAESLGDGDVSAGIRKALKQAQDARRES